MTDERKQELIDYGMSNALVREKRYKGNAKFNDWEDYYDKGNQEIRLFLKKLHRFLEEHVNQPYKNVYAKFCGLWPSRIGTYTDTRKKIRELCGLENMRRYRFGGSPFMVNEKGILKKNPESWEYRKREKKTIEIGLGCDTEKHWQFNKDLLKYPDVVEFLNKTIGIKNTKDIMYEEFLNSKILNILDNKKYTWGDFFMNHKHWYDCGQWIYKEFSYYCPITVEKGSSKYSQYRAEEIQMHKIARKKYLKERDEDSSTLLYRLEEKRRAKEERENEVNIERLGFDDETSFKGEFYHGQKRKKN